MERGAMRIVLLDALRDGPRHGYEIIKGLEERAQGRYAPSPGAVYPTLQYLEDLGLVQGSREGDRRVFALTEAGRAELESQAERINAFWSRFEAPEASGAVRAEVGFLRDELDDLSRTIWTGLREFVERGDRETARKLRRAVEACRNEIRDLIADAAASPPSEDESRSR
jgi:DNA-binding PadR family transcriptional regulator